MSEAPALTSVKLPADIVWQLTANADGTFDLVCDPSHRFQAVRALDECRAALVAELRGE